MLLLFLWLWCHFIILLYFVSCLRQVSREVAYKFSKQKKYNLLKKVFFLALIYSSQVTPICLLTERPFQRHSKKMAHHNISYSKYQMLKQNIKFVLTASYELVSDSIFIQLENTLSYHWGKKMVEYSIVSVSPKLCMNLLFTSNFFVYILAPSKLNATDHSFENLLIFCLLTIS